jgi:hypothetical protein
MGVDPQRYLDGAAAIARRHRMRSRRTAGDGRDEARGQDQARFVEAELAAALGGNLGELAEHDQLRQRRQRAGTPDFRLVADALDQLRRELEG